MKPWPEFDSQNGLVKFSSFSNDAKLPHDEQNQHIGFCCKQVEKQDVMEAFRLLEVALQQSATDHSTGKLVSFFVFSFSIFGMLFTT